MRLQKDGSPLESILLSHWLTAGICLLISLFLPFPQVSLEALSAIMVLGIIQIGLPAVLFSLAIKRVSAVQANLIAVIEPVFNPLWVFLAIGETPGRKTLLGGMIIILAVTMASVVSARRRLDVSASRPVRESEASVSRCPTKVP
jgi:drug/metabolite transporter (DMT)-like permease